MRSSPHMKNKFADRSSPTMSPRKTNSYTTKHHMSVKNVTNENKNDNVKSCHFVSSSVHADSPDLDVSAAVSSDDDSEHINVDKLKTIRNKAAKR